MANKLLQFFILFLSFSTISFAQDQLTVSAPESVAGVYNVEFASFGTGDIGTAGIAGQFVTTTTPSNEACDPFTDDLSGKIAIIDRGSCFFSSKVFNAQNQGALAVIICNNVETAAFRMAGGDNADDVKIPSVMMSLQDCNTLKTELNNLEGKLEFIERPPFAVETYWGNNGEGSFINGSLGEWTTNSLSDNSSETWKVRQGRAENIENITFRLGVPNSPSHHNGFIAFQADNYQDAGNGNFPYPYKGAELISPLIDCSNCINSAIEFYQYFAPLNRRVNSRDGRFLSGASLLYSLDGGNTYEVDTTFVNLDIAANESRENKLRVFLPQIDGSSQVKIKFLAEMSYYNWSLDEIKVIRLEDNNLSLINDFYALPPAVSIPASQVTPFQFVTDLRNIGASTQTNTKVQVTIEGDDNSIFTTTHDVGDIEPQTSVIDSINPEPFMPSTEIVSYTGQYNLISDGVDHDPTNNTLDFSYNVTDSLYAYEDGFDAAYRPDSAGFYTAGSPLSWAWGNAFYFPNGSKVKVSTIEVGIGNPSERVGDPVNVLFYKWVNNGDTLCQPNERELIGFAELKFSSSDPENSIYKLKLENAIGAPDDEIILEDNTTYILSTEYNATGTTTDSYLTMLGNSSRNYFGTIWLSQQLGLPRYVPVIGIPSNGDNLDGINYSVWLNNATDRSFGLDIVPLNRMYVIDKDATSTADLDIVNNFVISPNPADEFMNINLELDEQVENMFIQLIDVRGVIVREFIKNNVSIANETIDVSQLMSGNYFVTIATEKGTVTKSVIIK